jgi:hypothetical protein
MPTTKRYARIAITLPVRDLAAADRLARSQDRSRSWIVAEAVRRYAAMMDELPGAAPGTPPAHGEGPASATGGSVHAALGASRLAQLKRDLSLTPEARVRAAEETLRLTMQREESRAHRLVAFDRYEDFLDWKRSRDLRG